MDEALTTETVIPTDGTAETTCRWLWKHLVPSSSQSLWLQGELLRSLEKLRWEAENNGNGNWDSAFDRFISFLRETFASVPEFDRSRRQTIADDLDRLADFQDPCVDEQVYARLEEAVADFCRARPKLIAKPFDKEQMR